MTRAILLPLLCASLGLAVSGCADDPVHAGSTSEVPEASETTELPDGHPPIGSSGSPHNGTMSSGPPSLSAHASTAAPSTAGLLRGTVLEAIDAGSYTYVEVETDGQNRWIAGNRLALEVGDEVVFDAGAPMRNWSSDRLDRTWDVVYFVSRLAPASEAQIVPEGLPEGHPPLPEAADRMRTAPAQVDVPPLAEGTTVAALHGDASELAGSAVRLRGQVVKANLGILGRNWFHVQDGSGDPQTGTHDLTVTSNDTAGVGDVVVVEGILATERDFGGGYRYAVIVENASLRAD